MLATIALAITLGMKMRSFQELDEPAVVGPPVNIPINIPSPLLVVSIFFEKTKI